MLRKIGDWFYETMCELTYGIIYGVIPAAAMICTIVFIIVIISWYVS